MGEEPPDPGPAEVIAQALASEPIGKYFRYDHLPALLQGISAPFCHLAATIILTLPRNPERTVALRKLLESKDAAVRAGLP
jgi:hypothetical protein